ncbi:MAG: autotransporter outer membrane beta-barrel domain-containing protein [Selenomonas sp.]|uniref:autotransporter outer membrane beta-barrel domain-containing protein n=1 Tax=Selenomonas sp. TaxID=2053611 RepID=UPI0025CC328B|nr:autotransporter outer membrane beta-barrel domain-containing protein [Selenomonas sp.]MCR5756396.1 autotransporter outer membrane beta-barrel domain-containing protein [Selenomonas sp.]
MSGRKMSEKLHKAVGTLMLAACVWGPMGMGIAQADVEDTVVVPDRIMLIKEGAHQGGRELNIQGRGKSPILVYGGAYNPVLGPQKTVNMDGTNSFVDIYGGYHDDPGINVTNNIVNVDTGNTGWIIYDDLRKVQDSEHYTKLLLNDTSAYHELPMNVIAGSAKRGEVSGNVINLNGGTLGNYVIAAETRAGADDVSERLHDNVININGNMDLLTAKIYGAALFDDSDRSRTPFMGTNNTLNSYVKNVVVGELAGFNTYNIHVPVEASAGDTMITVSGGTVTNISASTVKGILDKTGSLPIGSTVNLLLNNSGVTDGQGTSYQGIHGDSGMALGDINGRMYELQVRRADANRVILHLAGVRRLYPQTKNLVQHKVPTLINRGADFLAGGAADSAQVSGAQVYTPFFAASHSAMRHTTGSYVDMRGYSMVLGMSRKIEKPDRQTLIAPVVEYGKGSYNSYMDDGTHGWGGTSYWGIGLVCRNTFKDGRFYEASLRGGQLRSDYSSHDYRFNGQKTSEHFDSSSVYGGFHLGLGREVSWHPRHKFTWYGKYFYTYNGSESYRLRNGQEYTNSAVHSHRLRLGIRDAYAINEKNKAYMGLAWEHEFDGSAYAEHDGMRTDSPTIRGDSYMLELGWVIKPYGDDKLSFDISATGWLGRQRGITGRFGINWMF